jgi:proliferating cell nuclear antigen
MVYILELKTTQATAIKIVTDAINSLLTDANFDFYPYYIEDSNSDNSSDSENNNYESESDNNSSDEESNTIIKKKVKKINESTDNKKKTIGGVVLKEVNKTGKILVYMRLDADKFEVYKYNYHKKKLSLGIDIGNLLKCLKCMSHFDTMTWLVDDEDINKLIVILESAERKEKKTFKLNLMDIEEETYDISPIQFPYSITLPSQDFHKYCKDMAGSTDKIEIKATSNKLFFSGKGEIGNIEFEVGETNGGLSIVSTTNNTNEIVQGLFELKFLLIFTKCTNLCNQVTMFIKNDYPIIITYQIAALGEIKLVLSPTKSD